MSNPKNSRNLFLLLIITIVMIVSAFIPNILSLDAEKFAQQLLGGNYKAYLLMILVVGTAFVIYRTTNIGRLISSKRQDKSPILPNVIWNTDTARYIREAKTAVENAQPEKALQHLQHLKSPQIQQQVSLLLSHLAHHRDEGSSQPYKAREKSFNKICHAIIILINSLEQQQSEGEKHTQRIKEYVRARCKKRLDQKLACRQPINMRRLPSKAGTRKDVSNAFVPYNSSAIQSEISKIFKDAQGRLLIVGKPGAGKTTLLLRLELSLLESERDAIPVLVDLATWKSDFTTLESWLEQILPSELGVNKALAKKILAQHPLIVLLDGLDEISDQQDRADCLDAIGRYGAQGDHWFVITSRTQEYAETTKDAPVHSQIEVGALTVKQIRTELETIGRTQPEALPLLQAINKDKVLRRAIQTPFYFNTLQLLFANGKRLSDLNFSANDVESRQDEIKERFIEMVTLPSSSGNHYSTDIRKHLSFVSYAMEEHNIVAFELSKLQYNWTTLPRKFLRTADGIRGLIVGLPYGLVVALLYILDGNLGRGLTYALAGVLLYSLVKGLFGGADDTAREITTKDIPAWS